MFLRRLLWWSGSAADGGRGVCGTASAAAAVAGTPTVGPCGVCCMNALYLGNDHTVSLTGAAVTEPDGSTTPLNAATVTYSLAEASTGTEIASGGLEYVVGSNGNYTGTIESSALTGLVAGTMYRLTITLAEDDYDAQWNPQLRAGLRGAA